MPTTHGSSFYMQPHFSAVCQPANMFILNQ
jgi:hypothetical protein